MSRNTLLAVALCVMVLIAYPYLLKLAGLEHHLRPTPSQRSATVDTTRAAADSARAAAPADVITSPVETRGPGPAPAGGRTELAGLPLRPVRAEMERSYRIETPLYHAEFSSRGARLISVELLHAASARGPGSHDGRAVRPKNGEPVPSADRVVLGGGPSFGIDLGSDKSRIPLDALVYAVSESLDAAGAVRQLTFTAEDSSGLFIRQTWRVRPETYALDLEVEMRRIPIAWRVSDYSLTTRSWPLFTEADAAADHNGLKATSLVGTNLRREAMGGLRKGLKRFEGDAKWAGVQTRYFMGTVAAVDASTRASEASLAQRPLTPEQMALLPEKSPSVQDVAVSSLVASLPGETDPVDRFLVYFGPSEFSSVSRLGLDLDRIVDLGWNWIRPFSKVLLRVMVWLDGLVKNYGVAIILLATLVRLLLHPLNMMSIKSMRAMQKLQPEMERLREKYKNDAQAMNTAVMALYKENKVNPAGGCLPMLLQMPLFIALYSVLWNATELRQEPFAGWIHDLSAPDKLFSVAGFPIRLLPLLMAGSGLLQQKLTPTDPRQVTTMYLMNVVMVVFFYNLPSGLVLYWTVMNVLTALQQWMALHEDGSSKAVVVETPEARKVARKAARK